MHIFNAHIVISVFAILSFLFLLISIYNFKATTSNNRFVRFFNTTFMRFVDWMKRFFYLKKSRFKTVLKFVLLALIIIFYITWNLTGNPQGYEVVKLVWTNGGSMATPFQTMIGIIGYWSMTLSLIFIAIFMFFKTKTTKALLVYLVLPLSLFNLIAFQPLYDIVRVANPANLTWINVLSLLTIAFEVGISMILALYYAFTTLFDGQSLKVNFPKIKGWKEVLLFVGALIGLFVASMPPNVPWMVIGQVKPMSLVDLGNGHRIQLLMMAIIPFVLYFLLKNQSREDKMFALLFISYGGLLNFTASTNYTYEMFSFLTGNFASLAAWPFHLCNTAMFIIPLVLTFKTDKIFYFTYFINVFGALMAMFLPNVGHNEQFFSPSMVIFWYNHIEAMMMPLLIVALGIYQKPKWREFWYSMIGFALYYLLVLFLNGWLANYNTSVDFFFINSDFILDKLGEKATHMLDIQWNFKIGDLSFRYYPLYQSLFFGVYILLALGMWFVYINAFSFAHKLHLVNVKNTILKNENKLFIEKLDGRPLSEPLYKGDEKMIKLTNFTKRYANSPVYAVHNVDLEVKEGQVFGFLGPNGAGKSTIIKCLVGIQPYTHGNAAVCGFDVASQSREAKLNIGFVPDHYALYENLTGREYINYIADMYQVSKEDRTQRIDDMVTRFELLNAFDNQIRTYSHGMKQKIAIIAALIHEPKVWILDEPLTGLDPQSIFQVKETMKDYAKKGNIVFFSSHIMDVVERLCDSFAIIKFGQIIRSGQMSEIISSDKTLEDFYMEAISDPSILPIEASLADLELEKKLGEDQKPKKKERKKKDDKKARKH